MLNVYCFRFLNKYSVLFQSCVKISEQYIEYLANYSLFHLKGSKPKVAKIEFALKSALHRDGRQLVYRRQDGRLTMSLKAIVKAGAQ